MWWRASSRVQSLPCGFRGILSNDLTDLPWHAGRTMAGSGPDGDYFFPASYIHTCETAATDPAAHLAYDGRWYRRRPCARWHGPADVARDASSTLRRSQIAPRSSGRSGLTRSSPAPSSWRSAVAATLLGAHLLIGDQDLPHAWHRHVGAVARLDCGRAWCSKTHVRLPCVNLKKHSRRTLQGHVRNIAPPAAIPTSSSTNSQRTWSGRSVWGRSCSLQGHAWSRRPHCQMWGSSRPARSRCA